MVGGRLTNSRGETFLDQYDPFVVKTGTFTEWNKSFISHASAREIRDGRGTEHGGVYYSRGDAPWENIEMVASIIFPKWKYKAVDLKEWGRKLKNDETVEVGPAVEYFEGGIVVDETFQSTLPGLFAAGECTLGVFGANRVFAAITEMLVHGADAGAAAAEYAGAMEFQAPPEDLLASLQDRALAPLNRKQGASPARIRRRIQEEAHRNLGPIRIKNELEGFLARLENVRRTDLPHLAVTTSNPRYNKEWLDALELPNIIQLLEAATRSALTRKESRGVHFREDFPETDNDHWLRESLVQLKGTELEVGSRPVTVTSLIPPPGKLPYLEFMKKMMAARSDTGGKH